MSGYPNDPGDGPSDDPGDDSLSELAKAEQAPVPDFGHQPVLAAAVMEHLDVQPGWTVVDATVGLGGHSQEIAERLGTTGRLIAIDRDPRSLALASERLGGSPLGGVGRIDFVLGDFADLGLILRRFGLKSVDAMIADLGVSSPQLDTPERGFSFRREGPLDMRMNPNVGEPAAGLVRRLSAEQLARILWEFGEERHSRRIAAAIVRERDRAPIETTIQLAEIVRRVMPRSKAPMRIDPATRTFQALRIAVNNELDALDNLLAQAPHCIRPAGRLVVISFHSLEDRRVKQSLREPNWTPLTKKPVTADDMECKRNPRARSAKLRAGTRCGSPTGQEMN